MRKVVLQLIQQEGKAGYNEIDLREVEIAPGFVYYQLVTKFGMKARKMLRVQ